MYFKWLDTRYVLDLKCNFESESDVETSSLDLEGDDDWLIKNWKGPSFSSLSLIFPPQVLCLPESDAPTCT